MMDVEEEIIVLCILEQTDMEQTVANEIERNDQWLTIKGSVINVQCSIFNVQFKRFSVVDGL